MENTTTESAPALTFDPAQIPRPLDDRVLVRRDMAQTTTDGGIILPDEAQTKPKRGTVLAVGPGRLKDNGGRFPMSVFPGDHVWFSSYAGTDLGGIEEQCGYIIMRADDIMCVDPE